MNVSKRPVYAARSADHALDLVASHGAHDFLFPTIKGRHLPRCPWRRLLVQVQEVRPRIVRARDVVIDLEADANEATKETIRSLGRALVAAGAAHVTCWSRTVARAA